MLEDMVTPDHKHIDSLPLTHSMIIIWVISPQMQFWYTQTEMCCTVKHRGIREKKEGKESGEQHTWLIKGQGCLREGEGKTEKCLFMAALMETQYSFICSRYTLVSIFNAPSRSSSWRCAALNSETNPPRLFCALLTHSSRFLLTAESRAIS